MTSGAPGASVRADTRELRREHRPDGLRPSQSFQQSPGLAPQSRRLQVTDSLQIASNLDSRMLFGLKNVSLKKKKGKREAGVRREVEGGFALPFRTALCILGEEAAAACCRHLPDVERVPSTQLSQD